MKEVLKDPKKCLTTELLMHELYDNNVLYSNEFGRRMKLLGLDSDTIESFKETERKIIEKTLNEGKRPFNLKNYWKNQSYIMRRRFQFNPQDLTVSEIIAMIEEAVYYRTGLFKIPYYIRKIVDYLSDDRNESLYEHDLKERLKVYGMNNDQIKAFIYNEYLLLQEVYYTPLEMKTKFGCSKPWSKEAIDLVMNGRVMLKRYFRNLE
ncbi:MAG: hypothetical protein J7K83_03980 [Candidatus Aenigmarchaeota archaeon]|nr:hypothetical protein [Candidatus Aenigmarchaeota archaeon]